MIVLLKEALMYDIKSNYTYAYTYLKMQSVTFAFLSPSMFESLELQFLAELSFVRRVVIRCSSTAPARINLMF